MTRRGFLNNIVKFGGGAISALLTLFYFLRFAGGSRKGKKGRQIYLGDFRSFREGEAKNFIFDKQEVAVVKKEERILALSTTCTHLGCRVYFRKKDKTFFCPCHRGVFDIEGRVIKGPPPKNLKRFQTEKRGNAVFLKVSQG